ncbi:hypothetical protein NDU88_001063 [Pleurodeles waltl]|uniref:Uncharacterized protein n=1 Tax=Pleurodeles waltl TaxID=8319 RepID=A0AAV7SZ82_PLEWA|nr:hypothetical protein NDU88_001063 [Pleurodeles waltl]
MTHERRKGLLLKLDPKLANLAAKDPGAKADGLLFGDNFIKELSKYVTTFASIDKVQQSLKKVFNSRFLPGPVEEEAAPPAGPSETKASEAPIITNSNSNKTFAHNSTPSVPEDSEGGINAGPITTQISSPSTSNPVQNSNGGSTISKPGMAGPSLPQSQILS